MINIEFNEVSKKYDSNKTVIESLSFQINSGEFVTLLGPSGCGKSTTLRILAGLENVSSGELFIKGDIQNDVPPKDRDIAMVFQNYALYPHMTVEENISFGLKMRKTPKKVIKEKTKKAFKLLDLEDHLKKYPHQLSGGQMQRVALGRAIVRESDIFLMDEPLSNLDAKLRGVMREEIVNLHKTLNATTVYVTHDQTEAMTMSDRVIVMNEGNIQQIGTPKEIYDKPNNLFVASFIGNPAMNLIRLVHDEDKFYIEDQEINLTNDVKEIILGIRPEDVLIDENSNIRMNIEFVEDMGSEKFLHGVLNNQKFIIRDISKKTYKKNDTVGVIFKEEVLHFYNERTSERMDNVI